MNWLKDNKFIIGFIVVFLFMYIWRPFFAGFYSDDWNLLHEFFLLKLGNPKPFHIDRFIYFLNILGNRPFLAVLYYIGSSLFYIGNTLPWHFYLTLLVFLTSLGLILFINEYNKFFFKEKNKDISYIIAIIWLVFPINAGYTSWISGGFNIIAILFFCLSNYYLIKFWNNEKYSLILSGIFLFLSYITYEAFYLQFVLLPLIAFFLRDRLEIDLKKIMKPVLLFLFIQIVVIVWNRISFLFFSFIINKSINSYLIPTFAANIALLPYSIFMSFKELWFVIIPSLIIMILHFRKNRDKITKITLLSTLIIVLMIIINMALSSAAGYTVWGIGSRSRTMMVIAFYLVLLMIPLINVNFKYDKPNLYKSKFALTLIIISFGIITFLRVNDWIKCWEIQKNVSKKIPYEKLNLLDSSLVLIDAPYRYNWISVFDAPWAIKSQIRYLPLYNQKTPQIINLNKEFIVGKGIKHPINNSNYVNLWVGKTLYQLYGGDNLDLNNQNVFLKRQFEFHSDKLYLWKFPSDSLIEIKKPQKIVLEQFYNYDYWITYLYMKLKKLK